MAFTYTDTLATDRDKIRFFIGDKVENAGPRPADGNFSDDEIAGLVTAEGTWEAAVAAAFETLAAEWIRYPSFTADNFALSRSHIAKNFQAQAKLWREGHGLDGPMVSLGSPTSRPVTRVDAYSDEYDSVTE
jgi:hypothetical protein